MGNGWTVLHRSYIKPIILLHMASIRPLGMCSRLKIYWKEKYTRVPVLTGLTNVPALLMLTILKLQKMPQAHSAQTFRNRLYNANLRARRPAVCPPLTAQNRFHHLAIARDYASWQMRQYRHIVFTDESKFFLDFHICLLFH